jgi:uncharacterized membrane protein
MTAHTPENRDQPEKPNPLRLYLLTLVAFLAIDMVWLGGVARGFYRTSLGTLLAPTPNWVAAALFYFLFVAGILVFVVVPGLRANSLRMTLSRAALFGLITYATYDLTNLATLKDWPALLTIVDMLWGTVLTVLVSGISFLAGKRLS